MATSTGTSKALLLAEIRRLAAMKGIEVDEDIAEASEDALVLLRVTLECMT